MTSSSPDPTADGPEAFFEDHASWARTSRALQRIARALAGDEAEDIVQGAWVEALERRQGGLGFGRLRSLVQSRSIDALRRRGHEPRRSGLRAAEGMAQDDDALGDTLEVQREVLDAVDSLDEPYRTTVYLRYFEALEPKAIARLQGTPEKTVKTRLTRSHQQLRERLRTRFRKKDGRWAPALLGFAGLPSPEASSTLGLTASTLLMKKIAIATLAVLAFVAGWVVLRWTREESTPLPAPSVAAAAASDEEKKSVLDTAPGDGAEPRREAVSSEPIPKDGLLGAVLERGSLRVRVLRANGAPAAGVHVVATAERESIHLQQRFRRQTDADGSAFFPALPLGPIALETDRRANVLEGGLEIRPDETLETTISLAEGLRVVGQVKNAGNLPVADAGIWLTSASDGWTAGAVATRSDANGRYQIEDVPEGQSIGAVAAGFQPSALFDLDLIDTSASPVTIDIALAPGGARLSGIVRDAAGSPIEDVLVVIGDNRRSSNMRMDHSSEESWSPRTVESEADGRYSIAGLSAGKWPVQARSFDHALWSGSVELSAGLSQVLNITLSRGAVVRGTVTHAEGQSVPRATLLAFHEPLREVFLQSGQVEHDGALEGPAAIADENGEYELRPVPPGEMWLYAIAPDERPDSKYGLVRYTKERLTIAADSETTWDPVLIDGRVIEGRALYNDGAAITGVFVTLQGPSKDEERVAYAEDGSFRFLNLGEGPFSLRVQMWTRPEGALEPFVEGVFPDGPPVDVVAAHPSPHEFEPSTVRVRLVDETQLERGEGTVVIESGDSLSWRLGEWKGGAWTFRLEEPGVYRAVGLYGERAICTGEDFEVRGGETLDLPDLVAGLGGTLVLHIERPEDPVPIGLRAFLRRKASKSAEALQLGGEVEVRIDDLEPGTGVISFLGSNIRQLALDFEVREGEETHLTVPLTAAVPVLYRIEWPSQEATGTLSIRFIDRQTGAVVDDFDATDLTAYSSPIQWHAFLPVGSFRFEVTKNGRLHHSEDFEVTSLDPKEAPKLGLP